MHDIEELVPGAVVLALLSYIISISMTKVFAAKNHYSVDSDQEFIALAAANFAGGFFGAYPSSGSLSRTALAAEVGAETQVHGLVTAVVIFSVLLFATHYFFYLPKCVLVS